MLDIAARIKTAATDETLRAAASAIWARQAPALFEPHPPRDGLRVSDAGQCVRKLFHLVNGAKDSFSPEVQIDNLDNGTLIGCWRMCLLAASLEADGYLAALEPPVEHDGTPGHIDLFYRFPRLSEPGDPGYEAGVIEHKLTMWPRVLTDPAQRARYQVLQAAKYTAAMAVEDFAIVTSGPASPDKLRVDWYKLGDWQHALIGEWLRLSAALGPVEPEGDPDAPWRCKGCFVTQCPKNPQYVAPGLLEKLEESYAKRSH